MDDLSELLELSNIDVSLHQLREAKSQIPVRRAVCRERRAADEAQLVEARAVVTASEHEQRQHEVEAADKRALLSKLEGQQPQVKSNEAYTVLLSEMERAKEAISVSESNELEAMEAIEANTNALSEMEAKVAGSTRQIEAEEQACDAQLADIESKMAGLEDQRATCAAKLSRDVVTRYEKITAARVPAVVIVTGETCAGCRVGIPAQAFLEILSGQSLVTCGTCRRILVHQDNLGGATA